MGTRSITYIADEYDHLLIALYRQFDGYPSVTGKDIVDFLKPFRVVNGLMVGADQTKTANGMGCLAAQFVAHFKQEPGGFYLHCPCAEVDADQEWEYFITLKNDELNLRINDMGTDVYDGPVSECDPVKLEEAYYENEQD